MNDALYDKIWNVLWDNADGKDYRVVPLSVWKEVVEGAMPVIADQTIEIARKALMEQFSDILSMEQIATASHEIAVRLVEGPRLCLKCRTAYHGSRNVLVDKNGNTCQGVA